MNIDDMYGDGLTTGWVKELIKLWDYDDPAFDCGIPEHFFDMQREGAKA